MRPEIAITTGSRLHFGIIGWGPEHARQFGGMGVMIAPPFLTIRCSPAPQFSAIGPLATRTRSIVERLARHWKLGSLPALKVEVFSTPPEHAGLGTGTALALSVATTMAEALQRGNVPLEELAIASGRGLRSAVGAHGFASGGLIYEDGKAPGETLGRLQARVTLPSDWRFVLVHTKSALGLAGDDERRAFELVRSTPVAVADQLRTLAADTIIPAARSGSFETFAGAISEYNRLAGSCFAAVQNGDYASSEIAELIAALQQQGVRGVGQSSWGPTVFAIIPHEEAALELASWLNRNRGYGADRVTIASAIPACNV